MVRVKTFILLAIGGLVVAFGFVVFAVFEHGQSYAYQQLLLTSNAFNPGQTVPAENTCDGTNVSPELLLQNIPDGSESIVIDLVDASAAQTKVNWFMWNVSPDVKEIPENANASVGQVGVNDAGKTAYAGPCASIGAHHYRYEAYALNVVLSLPVDSDYSDLQQAMQGHILGYGSLTGTYVTGK